MFGLPFSTTLAAFGLPMLIVVALIAWGLRYPKKDSEDTQNPEDSSL